MDSPVSGTRNVSVWATVAPGFLLTLACLAGEAAAQGPVPDYEKQASWAETMVSLRAQTAQRPRLFSPQRVFRPQNRGRFGPQNVGRSQAPAHPLVDLWARLEQDFPLECDSSG